jgi:hypothetical protein
MTTGTRGRQSVDEILGPSNLLHCSCGTPFERPAALSISSRHLWQGGDPPFANAARYREMGSSETIRARCPGCGAVRNFEQSGTPVSYYLRKPLAGSRVGP